MIRSIKLIKALKKLNISQVNHVWQTGSKFLEKQEGASQALRYFPGPQIFPRPSDISQALRYFPGPQIYPRPSDIPRSSDISQALQQPEVWCLLVMGLASCSPLTCTRVLKCPESRIRYFKANRQEEFLHKT